jgi:hypothetical protein
MPAPSLWLCRAASRRVVLRALLGLAAFAGITATHAGAPGAATLDTGQRQFSKAETLLWQTDHLANVRRPSRLRYRYTKTGTAEEQHTDVIDLEVLRVHPDGQKGVQVHYFTGKQEKPVPEQDPVTGNPVLAVYLQADVYAMNRRTEGGWRYFHRAIKTALAATNTVEPVSLDFHGRKVPASRVSITPYVGDAKRLPLKAYAHTTYAFTFADAVPGQLYEIRSLVPQPDGAPLIEEVLTFVESKDR